MDLLRYFLAFVAVVAFPPVVVIWLAAHLFAERWKAFPVWVTYPSLAGLGLACAWGLFLVKDRLLAIEFGASGVLVALGLVAYGLAVFIEIRTRKLLTLATLIGVPELTTGRAQQGLIRTGIYAHLRHPRYLELILGLAALALVSNYLAVYLLLPLWTLGIYLVTVAEERELLARFGDEYRAYQQQVPRLLPRWRDG